MADWDVTTAGALLEFDTADMTYPSRPIAIDANHYFHTYGGVGLDGFAEVLEINTTTWAVTTASTRLEYDIGQGVHSNIVQVDSNHFITFYQGVSADGFAQTLEINTTTWAVTTVATALEFDTANSLWNSPVQVDSNHFINFWTGTSSNLPQAQVMAVNTTTWAVTTSGARLNFDTQNGTTLSAQQVDTNHFICFWRGGASSLYGTAQVFTVNTTTWAVTTSASVLQFDTDIAVTAYMSSYKIDDNHFINFWNDTATTGQVQTFEVDTSTWAVTTAGSVLTYETTRASIVEEESIARVDSNHFLKVWAGTDSGADGTSDGFAQVFEVNTSTWEVTTLSAPFEYDPSFAIRASISESISGTSSKHLLLYTGFGADGFALVLDVEVPSGSPPPLTGFSPKVIMIS